MRLTILHTNDIHGREERIAQIATLVRAEKANAEHTVLYLDAGDVEETTNRLSNLTKGTATHRPHLLANFDGVEGTVPSVLLGTVGVIGLTAPFQRMANDGDWGFRRLDALEVARTAARSLRADGAELVVSSRPRRSGGAVGRAAVHCLTPSDGHAPNATTPHRRKAWHTTRPGTITRATSTSSRDSATPKS